MIITRSSVFSFTLGTLFLGALGCGAPSGLDLCNAFCDYQRRCGGLTDAQAANCHTDCAGRKGTLQDQDAANDKACSNASSVRKQGLDCLNQDCNKVPTCEAAVDTTCVAK